MQVTHREAMPASTSSCEGNSRTIGLKNKGTTAINTDNYRG